MKENKEFVFDKLVSEEYIRKQEATRKHRINARFMGCQIVDEEVYVKFKRKENINNFLICMIWFANGIMITLATILYNVH